MEKKERVFTYLPEKTSTGFFRTVLVKCFGDKMMGYDIADGVVYVVEMYQYKGEVYVTKEMQIKLKQ